MFKVVFPDVNNNKKPITLERFSCLQIKQKQKTVTKFLLSPPSIGGLTLYGKNCTLSKNEISSRLNFYADGSKRLSTKI